ncbi:protein KRI1 homolog [Aricia agestis]|uniref:protein KRI1 homolog n=1 Tax=Aricia agestis TaxID=91739 RepID=UPI001C20A821|nr:protein KRI1 homolog [Aricia agestis]
MPKKNKLFDDDSEEEVSIKTENEYAKKYDNWREKEELHKLEQKYGSALESGEIGSSDSEDESDEPLEVSEEVETQFLKTLSLLKTKDPRIYDPNFKFFDEKVEKDKEKKSEPKKLTFADSDDDSDDDPNIFSIEKKAEISDDDEKQGKKEDKDGKLKDYLIGKAEHVDEEVEKDLAPLRQLWSDPKLNDGEAFLRDYILNKRYLEDGEAGAEDKLRDDEALEEDERRVEEQGQFERAYNFRFEEPDEEYLKRFPRTMNYIRPKDDKRSRKRAELRARKEEEKRRKMEEIARLKALKLKEIREKIEKIKEVTGNQDLAFKEEDIESDFDPAEHDRRMREMFDDTYYGEQEDHKPQFPELDDELEIENWEKYNEENFTESADAGGELHCEDEDFNMDADYDPKRAKQNLLEELKSMGKKRRNRKKKSKLAELLSTEKPKFVPDADKTYDEFMEEYYKMDCEDVIGGDLPTRFKYRQVVPNDYGLTIEEILLADDKELTQWVPLKKIVKYRPDNVEKGEVKTYAQKAADKKLKKKILPSLFKHVPEEPEIVVPVEQTNKKKKKKKNKELNQSETAVDDVTEPTSNGDIEENKEELLISGDDETVIADNEVKNSEKVKKKKKKSRKSDNEEKTEEIPTTNGDNEVANNPVVANSEIVKKRKKKKKKKGEFVVENASDAAPSQCNTKQNVDTNSKDNLKRKLDTEETVSTKKRKKNKQNMNNKQDKNKFKQKKHGGKGSGDPMSNLSDERLKAYGLNPKKYRSFLKYKKF